MLWSDGKVFQLIRGLNKSFVWRLLTYGRGSRTDMPIKRLINQPIAQAAPKKTKGKNARRLSGMRSTKSLVIYQPTIATITHSAPAIPKLSSSLDLPAELLIFKKIFVFKSMFCLYNYDHILSVLVLFGNAVQDLKL